MDAPPTSVLLPAVEWTPACSGVLDQLRPEDELLVLCDDEDDPVTERRESLPENARVVAVGDPDGCSGKANAIATGMQAARHDRLVWTDDDFPHPPNWLATLQADYDAKGPVSETPFFVGRDPLAYLLEPLYALGGSLGVYAGDMVWGGSVIFEREDLDEDTFLADLRRTVSDDALLSEYLDVTAVRRTREVGVGGSSRATLERHVRFLKIVRHHEPHLNAPRFAFMVLVAVACLLAPLYVAPLATAAVGALYAVFGVRRWTFMLAYPVFLAQVPLALYAYWRDTFVWGGRRYHWPGKFDVRVVEADA
jgi:glycosyltransferase involved in cell wall biosynthesis